MKKTKVVKRFYTYLTTIEQEILANALEDYRSRGHITNYIASILQEKLRTITKLLKVN